MINNFPLRYFFMSINNKQIEQLRRVQKQMMNNEIEAEYLK